MKTIKKLLVAALAIISLNATAQTADEIVAKNNKAMGGLEKLKTLSSTKMTGTMTIQTYEFPVTFSTINGKGMRFDLEVEGTSNYQFYTTEKGSTFFPVEQMTEPKEATADEVKANQRQLDTQGSLVDSKAKGYKIEFISKEIVDSSEAYKLKITDKNNKESFYFIDTKTNFLIKTTSKRKNEEGKEVENSNSFADYKQNKDGFWFAYSITSINGTFKFDTIDSNVKIDENIFKN